MLRREANPLRRKRWRVWLLLAVASAGMLSNCQYSGREPIRIQVKVKKYAFDPPVIRVPQGALVELEISTTDVQHGFSVPALDIREPVPRGRTATVRFKAENQGQFKIQCSILCGPGHNGMQGTLIVE